MSIRLSSILLFALSIPFVMTYRISPGDTPYWLFTLIFISLLVNIALDLVKIHKNTYAKLKPILMWAVLIETLGAGFASAIIERHIVAPLYMIHDIILQLEAAIHFFLHGVNPYATTYFGTFLEQWHYSDTQVNPALYHFVMEPFYLVFTLPFYYVSVHTIGYFDGRIPLFILFLALLVIAYKVPKDLENKLLFVTLLAFDPAMLSYTLEGRSDVFMYAFLFAGFYLLYKRKLSFAGIPIALAFAIKQSAWPIFPFYAAFLYFQTKNIKQTFTALIPFSITFLVIVGPFLAWNPRAFIDSTVLYLSGSGPHSYPVSGYGLGMLLHEMGVIKDLQAYYPFSIWQAVICIPLLVVLVRYMQSKNSVQRLIIVYGIFLTVFWYLSRYFNNSHLGFISLVFISAYFWPQDTSIREKSN